MVIQMKILPLIAFLSSISQVQLLNYGPRPQFPYLFRESAVSPIIASLPFPQNGTAKQTPSQVREMARKFGLPYTIFYPLTFPQSRRGKNLNLSLQHVSLKDDHVESRIMNKPQPYPEFALVSIIPTNNKPKDVPDLAQISFGNFPQDSKIPILPPLKEYISTNKYASETQPETYKNRFRYPPEQYKNYTKDTNFQKPKPLKLRYVPPSLGYGTKNPPKYKILPLQMYNKVIVRPVAPPPPPPIGSQIQQWTSCICVAPYLCKNGVLNSGGRLRQARSVKYNFGNNTLLYGQSKIVNSPVNARNARDGICDADKICCEVNIDDGIDNIDDENYYPVATPPPERQYPVGPPRFPGNGNAYNICGIRSAYGIQARLKQLQYSADVAEFGEYPWQVAVLKKVVGDKNLYLCGGVLISPQWIATVAHCLTKDKVSPLLIRLGEWDVNRKDEVYPYIEKNVGGIVIHPEFDPESLQNDIALVQMQDPVDPRIPHVTPACLPTPGQIYDDKKCWVSGWGKDFFGPQGAYQNVLKEVDVPVVSRALCNTELRSTNLGPNFVLHSGFLCAGGHAGKDACTGDGGSPLVCQSSGLWYVVGLVSWGIGCGRPGVPGVYVNVLYYADWMNSIINR